MIRRFFFSAAAVAALAFIAAPAARAGHDCGYGYGSDYGYGWLYNSLRYNVPHFAAFPPVYYSYPVPRSYGYSPFAYPPHVMTPEVLGEPRPLEIINPHVRPNEKQPADDPESERAVQRGVQPEPLVIVNPFVTPGHAVVQQ